MITLHCVSLLSLIITIGKRFRKYLFKSYGLEAVGNSQMTPKGWTFMNHPLHDPGRFDSIALLLRKRQVEKRFPRMGYGTRTYATLQTIGKQAFMALCNIILDTMFCKMNFTRQGPIWKDWK